MPFQNPHRYALPSLASTKSIRWGEKKDVLTGVCNAGILHTIFFHRYFPSIRPKSRDLLDVTLPVVDEVELETLIDQRATALIRQIDSTSNRHSNSGRGQVVVQFFEKKRRKAWFTKAEEEVCWEQWTLDVTLATPRTESGAWGSLFTMYTSSHSMLRCWYDFLYEISRKGRRGD